MNEFIITTSVNNEFIIITSDNNDFFNKFIAISRNFQKYSHDNNFI